ncbi:hypothetical protein Tco_0488237, partial [Tanacetum coccineum]
IIMAQQQHAADVHPDELSSSSVPWIYIVQFWHTLTEDGSKYRLKFMLDKKELSLTLDDFRTIFHLPQANDNNHNSFVPPPSFLDMVPFYKQVLGMSIGADESSGRHQRQSWKAVTSLVWITTENEAHGALSNCFQDDQLWIRLCIPKRRSTRLTPPALVLNVDKADERILQDTLQVNIAEHKSRKEQEARENVALVDGDTWASDELKRWIEPRSNKESTGRSEIIKDKRCEITKEDYNGVDITTLLYQ